MMGEKLDDLSESLAATVCLFEFGRIFGPFLLLVAVLRCILQVSWMILELMETHMRPIKLSKD